MKYASSRLKSSTGCQHVKHGPRTILLKLLTILLFGSPFRWWTKQQVTAGSGQVRLQRSLDNGHVQPLLRAISVKTVELAGTSQLKIFVMVNIKKFVAAGPLENDIRKPRCSHGVAKPLGTRLWTRQILDQVISCVTTKRRLTSGRAPGPGLKYQATSCKHQASIKLSNQPFQSPSGKHPNQSNKRQASSRKLQAPRSYDHGTWILEKF